MQIHQLIVRFERDRPERSYPYIGQLCMLGTIHSLLRDYDCKRPVEFVPAFATAAGQIKMGQVLYGGADTAARLDSFLNWEPPPFWVLPQEGWRTARCLQAALKTDRAETVGVLDVIGPLTHEADDWLSLMEAAVKADIRFQLGIDTCAEPPAELITFTRMQFRKTAEWLQEGLEANGLIDGDDAS